MCGQAVCMHGIIRFGGGAFSPLPWATRSRRAVFSISGPPPAERFEDGPGGEARRVHQPAGPRGPEDGEPAVRPQPGFPIELPLHAGAEEVEFAQLAATGVADGLRDHLLSRRVLVE